MIENGVYKRYKRRVLDKTDITSPDMSISPRVLIDRVSKGLPVNATMTKHIPLPPDGMIENDFDTGTEEITDVTDAVKYADKIRSEIAYVQQKKQEAQEEAIGKEEPTIPAS